MAISGAGFFNVQKPVGVVDNVPVFNGVTDYTRRGDFQLNANGNLVNGAGYYLLGVTVDPKTGNPIGNVPQVLQFQNNFIPAQATTKITYAANLPTRPSTVASSTAAIGSLTALGGLNPADFTFGFNPQIIGTPPDALHRRHLHGKRGQQQGGGPGAHHRRDDFVRRRGHGFADVRISRPATPSPSTARVITFVAAGAVGNQLNVTDNVTTLLAKIDSITGTANPSTVTGGAITLHTGTTSNLTVTSSNAAAFGGARLPPHRDCGPRRRRLPRAPVSSSAATRRPSRTNPSAAAR